MYMCAPFARSPWECPLVPAPGPISVNLLRITAPNSRFHRDPSHWAPCSWHAVTPTSGSLSPSDLPGSLHWSSCRCFSDHQPLLNLFGLIREGPDRCLRKTLSGEMLAHKGLFIEGCPQNVFCRRGGKILTDSLDLASSTPSNRSVISEPFSSSELLDSTLVPGGHTKSPIPLCACVLSRFSGTWLVCNPTDRSPPGSPVHGILQTGILEWVSISSVGASSWPRDQTCVSYISWTGRWVLYHTWHLGSPSHYKCEYGDSHPETLLAARLCSLSFSLQM